MVYSVRLKIRDKTISAWQTKYRNYSLVATVLISLHRQNSPVHYFFFRQHQVTLLC